MGTGVPIFPPTMETGSRFVGSPYFRDTRFHIRAAVFDIQEINRWKLHAHAQYDPRRPLAYCLARRLARATFSFHAGALDVRPPLMCLSSARYRSSPSLRLPKHLAMPSKLVCRGSLQPTSQLAALPGRTLSLLWLRH